MSNHMGRARPSGHWGEAHDRQSIRELHERYALHFGYLDSQLLRAAAEMVHGFSHRHHVPLTDGYRPFASFIFKLHGGVVTIIFPCCHDAYFEDGTNTDRHVQVHTIGNVSDTEIDCVVDQMRAAIPARVLQRMPKWPPDDVESYARGIVHA